MESMLSATNEVISAIKDTNSTKPRAGLAFTLLVWQRNYKDIYGRSRDVNVVLYLRADFQHKFRFNLILPLVCYVGGSLKNGLVLTYIQAL